MESSKTLNNRASQPDSGFSRKSVSTAIVVLAISISVIHTIYMSISGVHQINRDLCVVYSSVPRWLFLIYEYFIEFLIVVIIGLFAGVLMEQYFKKIKRFFPKNQLLAFTYAAILPICSCGVIPLVETMKERVSLKVIITFLIAAPLLNPYIVFVSFSTLGLQYTLLRIAASFTLAIVAGTLTELLAGKNAISQIGKFHVCEADTCTPYANDPFVKTILMTRKLLPYIFWGGLLSYGLEYLQPKAYLQTLNFSGEWISMIIMAVIGVPLYVCNGADVLLIKPLLSYTDLTMGAGMVFSLTSASVCISSIAMLFKFLGKKITWILVGNTVLISLVIGFLINRLPLAG